MPEYRIKKMKREGDFKGKTRTCENLSNYESERNGKNEKI